MEGSSVLIGIAVTNASSDLVDKAYARALNAHLRKKSPRSDYDKVRAELAVNSTREFEGCAYSGGFMYPTLISGGETITGAVVLDLDSLIIPSQNRPVLDEHDESTDGLIGRTTSLVIDDGELQVRGVLYPRKSRAQKILSANDSGHEWQLSVGVDQFQIERVSKGKSVYVNQRLLTGPFVLCRNAYFTDLSFVSIGGDDLTWATIAASRKPAHGKFTASEPVARLSASRIDQKVRQAFRDENARIARIHEVAGNDLELLDVAIRHGWPVEHLEQKAIHWRVKRCRSS